MVVHKVSPGQWLFTLTKPTQLTIVYHSQKEAQELLLNKLGILQVSPDCKAYTSHTILESTSAKMTVAFVSKKILLYRKLTLSLSTL